MNRIYTPLARFGLVTSLALSVFSVVADTLVFKSGKSIAGTIVRTNGDDILLMADYGTFTFSLANTKEIRIDRREAATPERTGKLPNFKSVVLALRGQEWAAEMRQIPATVIDKGMLRNVPYTSFRCGEDYEVNVYGDLDHPAGIEAGVYRKLLDDASAKRNCLHFVSSLLTDGADRSAVWLLNQQADLKKQDDLTFEITPPTAEDAYMGWWVSVYSEKLLNSARASEQELKQITTPKVAGDQSADPAAWSAADIKLARGTAKNLITFTTKSGELIKDAKVVSVWDGVSLIWTKDASGGVVRLEDLPEDLQRQFGYDPRKTKAADRAEAEKKASDLQRAQALATTYAQPSQQSELYGTSYDGGTGSSGSYTGSGGGRVFVHGYMKSNGTYVNSYTRSAPHSGGGRR